MPEIKNSALLPAFIQEILKGLSQIMLQENNWTGLLFILGIMYGSPIMALAAIIATMAGTITAHLFNYNRANIQQGLFGFNAALVGVAVLLFFKPFPITWLLLILASVASTLLHRFFIKKKIPAYTLSFVIVVWILIFSVKAFIPHLLQGDSQSSFQPENLFPFPIYGYAQVIFQDQFLSGAIFFIAVFIHSPKAALLGLAGATISGIVAALIGVPDTTIATGLTGYNAVLCAIALGGETKKELIWMTFGVVLSLFISILMTQYNVIQLTFPFVAATFLTIILKNKMQYRCDQT